jgi:DnaJ-class molecular chaperone
MKENLYEILELGNFANMNEIREKYRGLIKKNHPDKGGKAENFEKIKKAYEILKSEVSKSDYDKKLRCIILKIKLRYCRNYGKIRDIRNQ